MENSNLFLAFLSYFSSLFLVLNSSGTVLEKIRKFPDLEKSIGNTLVNQELQLI